MDISIRGLTNPTGFRISDFENNIIVETKEYSDNDEGWPKLLKIIWRIIIYLDKRKKTAWLLTIIEKLLPIKYIRDVNEWHACEHKLIKLLVKKCREITFETLLKESYTDEHCGRQNRHLKKPSEEKIRETLRMAEEYYKKLSSKRAV